MNTPRVLQWGLLIYEALRLAVLTWIMTGKLSGEQFPILAFGAANALFPLMALFLLVDIRRYGVYASLYSAGKILGVITLVSCGVFWQDRLIQAIMLNGNALLYTIGSLLGIAMGDLVSAGGGMVLTRYSKRAEAVEAAVSGAVAADLQSIKPAADNGGL
ncbi:MAG: hypothetical protein LBT39_04425 [Treponema sp.]|jgi:hypothetical protein|nr:hypothetical protein [Treponema sp.]